MQQAAEQNNSRLLGGDAARRRLAWFLLLRLLVASFFLGGTILYQLQSGVLGRPELPFLYWMVGLTYLQSGLSAYLLQKTRRLGILLNTIIAWDLLLATFMIYLSGGSASYFSFLYILIIFSSSIFMRRRNILLVASAAAILYGSLLDLQYYGNLPLIAGLHYPDELDVVKVFYAIFLHVGAFFMTAILCSILVENRRRSELALEKKEIDLEELETLNRAILENINSGLMLVNPQGRVRSFNKAAEDITGYPMLDVYNRPVCECFPCFDLFDGAGFNQISRGQTVLENRSGVSLTLGYSTTLLRDHERKELGLLVVFQDLTELTEMDRRLRRADQQAAVGRLASGMAHEIRNPLASISGSIQLMLEGGEVNSEDRRLMQIVVNEADRLSQLLTDFLSFAKPPTPNPEPIVIADLCDQVIDMVQADHRFCQVAIKREYGSDEQVVADRNLLQQVVWDLIINAAEAMGGAGTVYIGFDPDAGALYVEDTGPGIDAEQLDRIFEPFFTTKESGTGLGLATVHTIIESHHGMVDVVAGRSGGARFVITLPAQGGQAFAVFEQPDTHPETD